MTALPLSVLVLCTGNSARSILAEAIFARAGGSGIVVASAGSKPKGTPHPDALALLAARGYDVSGFSSKSWDVFTGPDARPIDLVVTVCDSAAGEACPLFPGAAKKAHWGVPDPAYVEPANARAAAFEETYRRLDARIAKFLELPLATMSIDEIAAAARVIGETTPDAEVFAEVGPGVGA